MEIDLKYYYLKLRECELISPKIKAVYDEIKNIFTDAFVNGKLLILNFSKLVNQYFFFSFFRLSYFNLCS